MTAYLDREKLGEWIRKERKKKDLRQGDLADSFLSQSAISHIESGKVHVSKEKIEYLLEKLGLDKSELDHFLIPDERLEEESLYEELKLKLVAAETIVDLVDPEEGLNCLRSINLPQNHLFQANMEYIKGKAFRIKKKWDKAYDHFFQSIHLVHATPGLKESNIESACFHELSFIEYSQNHFHRAVEFAEEALSTFQINGERQYYYDLIRISQVIYLEKVNRIGEAQKILDEMARGKNHFPSLFLSTGKEASLNAYEMQTRFLQRGKQYPQAIDLALQGLELARIDKMYDRSFELLTTLGSIYIEMNKLHLAECCFKTALSLKHKIKRGYLLAYVYNELGKLYDKQEERDRAEKEFQQALKYSRKNNDLYREVDALLGLGEVIFHQGKYDQAVDVLNDALTLAKLHSLNEKVNRILLLMGQCLVKMGDPKFQDIAMDFFYVNMKSIEGGETMRGPFKRHAAGDPPTG